MFGVGFVFVALGLFLVDCAVQGRHPIATLEAMVSDPANYRATLEATKGTVEPSMGTPFASASSDTTSGAATAPSGSASPSVYTTPTSGATPSGAVSGAAAGALAYARAQIGKPYGWGKTGPDEFDCSGLTYMAYKSVGIKIGRTTSQQIFNGKPVAKADLRPGDLVFPHPGHVQMYAGNGNIVEAPHTGEDVMERAMWGFWIARRISAAPKATAPGLAPARTNGVVGT